MLKSHVVAALLALGGVAALPACSFDNNRQSTAAAPMPRQQLSSEMVMQVQTALQQQGVYQGNVDGLWGPATQSAVQNYQQAHGLTANGQLDSATLASLNLGGAAPAPQPTASAAPPPAALAPAPATAPPPGAPAQ